MNYKLLTGRENDQLVPYQNFLVHQEAISSFKKLVQAAKDEIDADLQIVSSFRDFERQQRGWDLKATGQRPLYDDNDTPLNFELLTKQEILFAILRWSAVPGASRHHWGTDIDVFDANQLAREDVQLLASECTPSGPCGKLHLWLDEKIKTNQSYGFFRPYENDLGGVGVEKWHLSYAPVSQALNQDYTLELFQRNIEESSMELKDILLQNVELVFKKYVKNISFCPF